MISRPKAFISYSHNDREIATRIAESLRANGIEVWFDRWEILAGDSLIEKIFEEGLSGADAFLIIISNSSIKSRWVQQELDAAMIKRIEGVIKILPVLVHEVEMPESLRSMKWIRLTENFDDMLRELQRAIFRVHERPPIGEPPGFIKEDLEAIQGLSKLGIVLGRFLIATGKHEVGNEETFRAGKLAEQLGLSPQDIDDAIDELEALGLIETSSFLGTHPYSHGDVTPTYALFLHFRGKGIEYDPEEDIKAVASAVAADKETDGHGLVERTRLSALRINRAVAYLKDYGIVRVYEELGTAPFDFSFVEATGMTRRFVAENCK